MMNQGNTIQVTLDGRDTRVWIDGKEFTDHVAIVVLLPAGRVRVRVFERPLRVDGDTIVAHWIEGVRP